MRSPDIPARVASPSLARPVPAAVAGQPAVCRLDLVLGRAAGDHGRSRILGVRALQAIRLLREGPRWRVTGSDGTRSRRQPFPGVRECRSVRGSARPEQAAARLSRLGYATRSCPAREEIRVGQWVRLENLGHPDDAANALGLIRSAGIADAYVIAEEGTGTTISLGVFADEARARQAVTIARMAGIEPQVVERLRPAERVLARHRPTRQCGPARTRGPAGAGSGRFAATRVATLSTVRARNGEWGSDTLSGTARPRLESGSIALGIAQLVEQPPCRQVGGSTPSASTTAADRRTPGEDSHGTLERPDCKRPFNRRRRVRRHDRARRARTRATDAGGRSTPSSETAKRPVPGAAGAAKES